MTKPARRDRKKTSPQRPPGGRRGEIIKCPVCRKWAPCSFEHVPPRSCGNDRAVMVVDWLRAFRVIVEEHEREPLKYRNILIFDIQKIVEHPTALKPFKDPTCQNGYGYRTICEKCNNVVLNQYISAFIEWDRACHAARVNGGIRVTGDFELVRIFKCILGMFISANTDLAKVPEIAHIVRNPWSQRLPQGLRLYAYAREGEWLRATGTWLLPDADREPHAVCEVQTFTLGYVLALDGTVPRDDYVDITQFSKKPLHKRHPVDLFFPTLHSETALPLDHRTAAEIAAGKHAVFLMAGSSAMQSRGQVPGRGVSRPSVLG